MKFDSVSLHLWWPSCLYCNSWNRAHSLLSLFFYSLQDLKTTCSEIFQFLRFSSSPIASTCSKPGTLELQALNDGSHSWAPPWPVTSLVYKPPPLLNISGTRPPFVSPFITCFFFFFNLSLKTSIFISASIDKLQPEWLLFLAISLSCSSLRLPCRHYLGTIKLHFLW